MTVQIFKSKYAEININILRCNYQIHIFGEYLRI